MSAAISGCLEIEAKAFKAYLAALATLLLFRFMQRLGDYYIVSPLGSGAYGAVNKALSESGELVAIKSILVDKRKPEVRSLLRKEISAMRAIKHPNVISLQQVFEASNQVNLALETIYSDFLHNFIH